MSARTQREMAYALDCYVIGTENGAAIGNMVCYLNWDRAREFVDTDAINGPEHWEEYRRETNPEQVLEDMRAYMPTAWAGVARRRHETTVDVLEHIAFWLWMLKDDRFGNVLEYGQDHGAEILAAICEEYGWDYGHLDTRLRLV